MWILYYRKFGSVGKNSNIDKTLFISNVGSANFGDYVFIRDGLRIETINKRSTIIFKEFIKNYSSYKFDV